LEPKRAKARYALGWEGFGVPSGSNEAEQDAARWRKLELEARSLASAMTDPEPQRIMLFIAEGYKLLRERAEFRAIAKK
jgi:hypothetical protein